MCQLEVKTSSIRSEDLEYSELINCLVDFKILSYLLIDLSNASILRTAGYLTRAHSGCWTTFDRRFCALGHP